MANSCFLCLLAGLFFTVSQSWKNEIDGLCVGLRPRNRFQFCCAGFMYNDPSFKFSCCNGRICRDNRFISARKISLSLANAAIKSTRAPVTTLAPIKPQRRLWRTRRKKTTTSAPTTQPWLLRAKLPPTTPDLVLTPISSNLSSPGKSRQKVKQFLKVISGLRRGIKKVLLQSDSEFCGNINMTRVRNISSVLHCCDGQLYDARYFTCKQSVAPLFETVHPDNAINNHKPLNEIASNHLLSQTSVLSSENKQNKPQAKNSGSFTIIDHRGNHMRIQQVESNNDNIPLVIVENITPKPITQQQEDNISKENQYIHNQAIISLLSYHQQREIQKNTPNLLRFATLRCNDLSYYVEAILVNYYRCCGEKLFDTRTEDCHMVSLQHLHSPLQHRRAPFLRRINKPSQFLRYTAA